MNELNITEYSSIQSGVGMETSLRVQKVEYSHESGVSDPLNERASFVRLISDTDCRILFTRDKREVGTTSTILPAGVSEYFAVSNPPLRISVIQL